MKSLLRENQADIIEAFNSTSRYLDNLLNIDNIYIFNIEKYSISLKTFLQQGISEPEFYGDLVYRFRKKCR